MCVCSCALSFSSAPFYFGCVSKMQFRKNSYWVRTLLFLFSFFSKLNQEPQRIMCWIFALWFGRVIWFLPLHSYNSSKLISRPLRLKPELTHPVEDVESDNTWQALCRTFQGLPTAPVVLHRNEHIGMGSGTTFISLHSS